MRLKGITLRLSGGHEHPWEEASPPEAGDCSPKTSITQKALMRMGPTGTTPTPCVIVMMYGTPPPHARHRDTEIWKQYSTSSLLAYVSQGYSYNIL